MHDLNKFDPLPALGAKVTPLNTKPLTPEQKKAGAVLAFERSKFFDVALLIETACRENTAEHVVAPSYFFF